MKNNNYIINGILIVAIIVLFILQFTGRKADIKQPETAEAITESTNSYLPIAFVQTDSLMPNYIFFNDLSKTLMKNLEDKRLIIKQREERFQKEYLDYQEKAQRNVFISPERQRQEENRLYSLQQELNNLMTQVEQEMSLEQSKMSQQLQDTIVTALKQFNTPKKYEYILSNAGTDNILYAGDEYDITKEVIEFLNARYTQSQ